MAMHAVYSPSSSKRWMSCPGSVALSTGLPNTSSAYADEGTAAHFLAAECLRSEANAGGSVGSVIELRQLVTDGEHYEAWGHDPHQGDTTLASFVVSDDMAEAVQTYVDYVRDLKFSSNGILFVEVQVPINHLTGEEGATGTSDAIILTDDEIIVVDLKFGRGVDVSAIENSQMLMYASGALRYIEDLVGGTEKIKRVRMAISQPRLSSMPSEWTCATEDLHAFEAEVRKAAVEAEDMRAGEKGAAFSPSEDACRFCRAAAICPELAKVVEEVTTFDFDNLDAVLPVVTSEPPDNALLSKRLKAIDLVEMWCKAIRSEAESQLLQGNTVPGYKLVRGKMGNRSWTDEGLAERTLKKLKLKKEEMYETKLISPTTAEKVIGKASESWKQVQNLVTQKEGGLSVAPESEKRPAVEIKPITDGFVPLD